MAADNWTTSSESETLGISASQPETESIPTPEIESNPTSGTESIPTSGTESIPTPGIESIPTSGTESFPTSGTESFPTSGTETVPTSGTESFPTSGTESFPTSGTESFPTYETGRFPIYGTGIFPAYEKGRFPFYGTGLFPAYKAENISTYGAGDIYTYLSEEYCGTGSFPTSRTETIPTFDPKGTNRSNELRVNIDKFYNDRLTSGAFVDDSNNIPCDQAEKENISEYASYEGSGGKNGRGYHANLMPLNKRYVNSSPKLPRHSSTDSDDANDYEAFRKFINPNKKCNICTINPNYKRRIRTDPTFPPNKYKRSLGQMSAGSLRDYNQITANNSDENHLPPKKRKSLFRAEFSSLKLYNKGREKTSASHRGQLLDHE